MGAAAGGLARPLFQRRFLRGHLAQALSAAESAVLLAAALLVPRPGAPGPRHRAGPAHAHGSLPLPLPDAELLRRHGHSHALHGGAPLSVPGHDGHGQVLPGGQGPELAAAPDRHLGQCGTSRLDRRAVLSLLRPGPHLAGGRLPVHDGHPPGVGAPQEQPVGSVRLRGGGADVLHLRAVLLDSPASGGDLRGPVLPAGQRRCPSAAA
eukprot:scaffold1160_cov261-Pinguiococcus_pyrenoidosus.AAC.4